MKSPGFRTLTGAVVTLLLVLFVFLITTTLIRFPMEAGESDASATPTLAPGAATTPAQAAAAEDAAATTPEIAATAALTQSPASAPESESGLSVNVQPTPTRRDAGSEEAAAPASAPSSAGSSGETPAPAEQPVPEGLPLPTPDPAAAPEQGLQVFGNANWVNDVAFEDGSLWAATSGGALRWDTEGGTAQSFTMSNGLGTNQLTAAVNCPLDGFGVVFGSASGLQVFDPEGQSWKRIVGGGPTLRHNDVSALACDTAQGILAVGYESNGVDIYRTRTGRWSYVERSDEVAPEGVGALAIGEGGAIWIASGGSLARMLGTSVTNWSAADSPLTGEEISALTVDADNVLWLTAGDRLYRLDGDAWDIYEERRAQGDFPSGSFVDVKPAQGGRVWLLSGSAELCRFDPEFESCVPFHAAAEGMARGAARALDVSSSGSVAYGTAGQGSSLLTRNRWTTLAQPGGFPAGNRIFALAADAHGFLWAATNAGVQQVDPAQPQQVSHLFTAAGDGVIATNVRTLFADARGGVWLGGIGASFYDGRRWTHYTQADGLAGDEITAISEDGQGRIWFGTRTGLSIWTGTTFFNLTGDNGLPDSEILALAADGSSMWIGSAGGGLYRFERNQLQVLTEENVGLPSNRILALLATSQGALLVGTDKGAATVQDGEVTLVEALPEDRITAMAASTDGSLWAGTAANGLYRSVDGVEWEPVDVEGTTVTTSVRALAVDLFGGAWIAGDAGGLVRVAP